MQSLVQMASSRQLSYADSFSDQLPSYQPQHYASHFHGNRIKSPLIVKQHRQHHQKQQQQLIEVQNSSHRQKTLPFNKHRRGKSMDLNEIHTFEMDNLHNKSNNLHKIIINNDLISQLRDRNNISDMRYCEQKHKKPTNFKQARQRLANKKKNKNDLINTYHNISTKPLQSVFSIYQTKKKHIKNNNKLNKQSSKTFSMKVQHKQDKKSHEIIIQRRCKSSLKEKYNSKILNELKSMGNKMPLNSKLNSLYSNTTSIYNSFSQLQEIKINKHLRIATQQTLQINEIRKYQSQILIKDQKHHSLRLNTIKSVVQQLNETVFEKVNHTKSLIDHYISMFSQEGVGCRNHTSSLSQSQGFLEVQIQKKQVKPTQDGFDLKKIEYPNHLESFEGIELKNNSFKNLKPDLQSPISIQSDVQKLNNIIKLIKQEQFFEKDDKKIILSTIVQWLQKQKQKGVFIKEEYKQMIKQQKQDNIVGLQDSNLSSLSINQSTQQQIDIHYLNLQLLDNALKKRIAVLREQMKWQMQKIGHMGIQKPENNTKIERIRIQTWFDCEIKQAQKIRNQLWREFNNAKKIVQQSINNRKCSINQSKSQQCFKKTRSKLHKKQTQNQKVINNSPIKQNKRSQTQVNFYQSPEQFIQVKPLLDLVSSNKQQIYNISNDKSSLNSFQIQQYSAKHLQFSNESPPPILNRCDNMTFDDIIVIQNGKLDQSNTEKDIYCLNIQDKQSIFEFIFLDLCVEMSEQYKYNDRILVKIHNFIKNTSEEQTKVKGFRTNSGYVREYLFQFMNFLRKNSNLLSDIHINLDQCMGPSQLDLLKYFTQNAVQEINYMPSQILNPHIFDIFQSRYMKTIQFSTYYDHDLEKQLKRQNALRTIMHVHNKAIFDSLNEQLDKHRLFGTMGKPFIWKKTPKFDKNRTTTQKNQIILESCLKCIENSTYMCGYMIDKQDCPLKNNKSINQQYIEQIRSDRLSKFLAAQLAQMQQKLMFIDDQQAQFLVNLGNVIFEKMLHQAINETILFF